MSEMEVILGTSAVAQASIAKLLQIAVTKATLGPREGHELYEKRLSEKLSARKRNVACPWDTELSDKQN